MLPDMDKFLSLLDKVERRGHDKYMARCPAHDDKTPSLSIWRDPQGDIALYCFAGCSHADIRDALKPKGFDWYWIRQRDERPRFDQVKQAEHDKLILQQARADRAAGKRLSEADKIYEAEAYARVLRREQI